MSGTDKAIAIIGVAMTIGFMGSLIVGKVAITAAVISIIVIVYSRTSND